MASETQFVLYRESVNRATGKGAGDDALPFIGEHLLSVADGAGGRAYPLQPNVNPLLLNPQCSFETAVEGIIETEEPKREDYKKQYLENFFNEGFDLSRDYAEAKGRKSSYFGSRLASIFIRRLLDQYLPDDCLEGFFSELNSLSKEERKTKLYEFGVKLASELYKQMQTTAKNCGLSFGDTASVSNVNLMSTTYSGIVFAEHEDYIDTLTIQAGDSLPYALVFDRERDTVYLKLLQKAQERSDGGMTNCICSDAPFFLSCTYVRLEKPCALICASDGCFDAFATPAHFERFLLHFIKTGLQADDLDEASQLMKKYLMTGVTTDDSSSLAFKAFGDINSVRFQMQSRVDWLKENMNLDDPEWYSETELPEDKLNTLNIKRDEVLRNNKEGLLRNSEWLQKTVYGEAAESEEEIERKREKRKELEREKADAQKELEKYIMENWLGIQEESKRKSPGYLKVNPIIQNSKLCMREMKQEQKKILNGETRDSFKSIREQLLSIVDAIDPDNKESGKVVEYITDVKNSINKALDDMARLGEELEYVKKRREDARENSSLAITEMLKMDALLIKMYCLLLLGEIKKPHHYSQGPLDPALKYIGTILEALQKDSEWKDTNEQEVADLLDELEGLQDVLPENPDILTALEKMCELESARNNFNDEQDRKRKAMEKEYLERPLKLAKECYLYHSDTIKPEFLKDLQEQLADIQKQREQIENMLRQKSEAIKQYNDIYESLVCEEVG